MLLIIDRLSINKIKGIKKDPVTDLFLMVTTERRSIC